jgi:hypothetical protein
VLRPKYHAAHAAAIPTTTSSVRTLFNHGLRSDWRCLTCQSFAGISGGATAGSPCADSKVASAPTPPLLTP